MVAIVNNTLLVIAISDRPRRIMIPAEPRGITMMGRPRQIAIPAEPRQIAIMDRPRKIMTGTAA